MKKTGLCLLSALAVGASMHMSCSRATDPSKPSGASSVATVETQPGGDRPGSDPPTWPRFSVNACWDDPRVVTIMRSWAEPLPRPEYYVFELVDEGRKLARLHKQTLRYKPWTEDSLGKGRFLVMLGEVPGYGLTENCIGIIDFVRNVSAAWRQQDFIPADIRKKLPGEVPTFGWYGGDPWFDTERLLYYPNGIEACRDRGFPFLVVDLRSRSVKLATVPDYFGPEVVRWTRRDYSLRWSMGNAGELASNVPSLLPTYLLAIVHDRDATEDAAEEHDRIERLAALGLVDGEPSPMQRFVDHPDYIVPCWRTCFKLDATTGDYVRCPVSEWVARSEKAETR